VCTKKLHAALSSHQTWQLTPQRVFAQSGVPKLPWSPCAPRAKARTYDGQEGEAVWLAGRWGYRQPSILEQASFDASFVMMVRRYMHMSCI
jgi:hypothetical protein